jgi:hypothetical protein
MSIEARSFVEIVMAGGTPNYVPEDLMLPHFRFEFPADKTKIRQLSYGQKMEWYQYQFQKDPQRATVVLSSQEFAQFWKWHVLIPMKLKRFYYRLKNFEAFKKYPHISEMKKKIKKHAI